MFNSGFGLEGASLLLEKYPLLVINDVSIGSDLIIEAEEPMRVSIISGSEGSFLAVRMVMQTCERKDKDQQG
jgi:hypothetical protein